MTEILSGVAQSLLGKSTLFSMPEVTESEWRNQQYYQQMPMLTSQWGDGQASQMGGMHDVDLRIFQHETNHYTGTYGSGHDQIISPGVSYYGEGNGASDVDMATPSTAGFPVEVTEGYHVSRPSDSYLRPPTIQGQGSASTQSPKSAQGDISPRSRRRCAGEEADARQRPGMLRSATAPEPRLPPALKRMGTSEEDGDDDYVPTEDVKGRGRKRQRIPHTAVERRYRENLNAHLDKLRQTVPTLAARTPGAKGGEATHEGVKPSKCEILNGAIEHIGALDKENQTLRNEVKMLRSRIEEMDRWHRGNSRHATFGA